MQSGPTYGNMIGKVKKYYIQTCGAFHLTSVIQNVFQKHSVF